MMGGVAAIDEGMSVGELPDLPYPNRFLEDLGRCPCPPQGMTRQGARARIFESSRTGGASVVTVTWGWGGFLMAIVNFCPA